MGKDNDLCQVAAKLGAKVAMEAAPLRFWPEDLIEFSMGEELASMYFQPCCHYRQALLPTLLGITPLSCLTEHT
jgi:hypothetical protein